MSNSLSKPYVLAITGSIGCGKSTVRKCLEALGVTVLDADAIGHQLLNSPNPAYQAVLNRFGHDLVDTVGGPINRAQLAAIVFKDATARHDLEKILHPAIRAAIRNAIAAHQDDEIIAVEVPLLFEAHQEREYDEVWAVIADNEVRIKRLCLRDNVSREVAQRRISAQWSQEKKAALADRVIDNSGTLDETRAQVLRALNLARAMVLTRGSEHAEARREVASMNDEYKDILRRFGYIGTDQALAKLGDIVDTDRKEADASMTMTVDACTPSGKGENGTTCEERKLKVRVQVSVERNTCDNGCPCDGGCGNCPCPCPCPPPQPPSPPNPKPEPPQPKKGKRALWLVIFLCLVVAVMALCAMHQGSGSGSTPANPNPPVYSPPVYNPRPVTPQPPPQPVSPPPSSCPGSLQQFSDIPALALPHAPNYIRASARHWWVQYYTSCGGARVWATDGQGRLVNWEEYGPGLSFRYQWNISYSGNSVRVDRFVAMNNFVGRTVYTYDQTGLLVSAVSYDGNEVPVLGAQVEHNAYNNIFRVTVGTYDQVSRQFVGSQVSTFSNANSVMQTDFYLYDLFAR